MVAVGAGETARQMLATPTPPVTPRRADASPLTPRRVVVREPPQPAAVKLSPSGHTPRRGLAGLSPLEASDTPTAVGPDRASAPDDRASDPPGDAPRDIVPTTPPKAPAAALEGEEEFNPASAWKRFTNGQRCYFGRPEPFSKQFLGTAWLQLSLQAPPEGICGEASEASTQFELSFAPLEREQRRKVALAAVRQRPEPEQLAPGEQPPIASESSTDPEFWRKLLRKQNWMRQMLDGTNTPPGGRGELAGPVNWAKQKLQLTTDYHQMNLAEEEEAVRIVAQARQDVKDKERAAAAEVVAREATILAAQRQVNLEAEARRAKLETAMAEKASRLEYEQAEQQQRIAALELQQIEEERAYVHTSHPHHNGSSRDFD